MSHSYIWDAALEQLHGMAHWPGSCSWGCCLVGAGRCHASLYSHMTSLTGGSLRWWDWLGWTLKMQEVISMIGFIIQLYYLHTDNPLLHHMTLLPDHFRSVILWGKQDLAPPDISQCYISLSILWFSWLHVWSSSIINLLNPWLFSHFVNSRS